MDVLFYQLKNPTPTRYEELKLMDLTRFRAGLFLHTLHANVNEDMKLAFKMVTFSLIAKGEKILKKEAIDTLESNIFKKRLLDIMQEKVGCVNKEQDDGIADFLRSVSKEQDDSIGDLDSTYGRARILHETIRLTSYWEEQVQSTKFSEEDLAILVTVDIIKKWDSKKFVEKAIFNVEFLRKHVQLTIQSMIDTEEEKTRKEKHMIKIKEELVSFEYLEKIIDQNYIHVVLLLIKSLLEVETNQEELIRGLVQALGANGSLESVVTEEFYIMPVQQYIILGLAMLNLHSNLNFEQFVRKPPVFEIKTIMAWLRGEQALSRESVLFRGPYLLRKKAMGQKKKIDLCNVQEIELLEEGELEEKEKIKEEEKEEGEKEKPAKKAKRVTGEKEKPIQAKDEKANIQENYKDKEPRRTTNSYDNFRSRGGSWYSSNMSRGGRGRGNPSFSRGGRGAPIFGRGGFPAFEPYQPYYY